MSNKELDKEDGDESTVESIDLDSLPEKDRAKSLNLFYELKTLVTIVSIVAVSAGILLDKLGAEIGAGTLGAIVIAYLIGSRRE